MEQLKNEGKQCLYLSQGPKKSVPQWGIEPRSPAFRVGVRMLYHQGTTITFTLQGESMSSCF